MSISENERYWQNRAQRAEAECERLRAWVTDTEQRVKTEQQRSGVAPPPVQGGDFTLSLRELQHGLNCLSVDNAMDRPDFQLAWDIYEAAKQCATPPPEGEPELAKHQPCGCVVCTCDDEDRCHGCGAKHCGTHPVGQFPDPVYADAPRTPEKTGDALAALNRIALIVYDEESPEPTFVGDMADEDFDIVRRHLTASGVPYVPDSIKRLPDVWLRRSREWKDTHGIVQRRQMEADAVELRNELEAALASAPAVCEWAKDDEGFYQTDCGSEFDPPAGMFLEDMPNMRYCSSCGRRIQIAAAPTDGRE